MKSTNLLDHSDNVDATASKENSIDIAEMISSLKESRFINVAHKPSSFMLKITKNNHFILSAMIIFLTYAFLIFHIFPLILSLHTFSFSLVIIISFHFFFFMFIISFIATAVSDAGTLSEEYLTEYAVVNSNKQNGKFSALECFNWKDRSLKENICRYCLIVKPERVHHCRKCKKCYRRMDHHCIYVNNCIAISNYKLFINMLFFGVLSTIIVSITILDVLRNLYNNFSSICLFVTVSIVSITTNVTLSCLLFYFLIYHLNLMCRGLSQMEDMLRYDQRYDEYYNEMLKERSVWRRINEVMGSFFLWLIPIKINDEYKGYSYL